MLLVPVSDHGRSNNIHRVIKMKMLCRNKIPVVIKVHGVKKWNRHIVEANLHNEANLASNHGSPQRAFGVPCKHEGKDECNHVAFQNKRTHLLKKSYRKTISFKSNDRCRSNQLQSSNDPSSTSCNC
jgi:hypothetical protein